MPGPEFASEPPWHRVQSVSPGNGPPDVPAGAPDVLAEACAAKLAMTAAATAAFPIGLMVGHASPELTTWRCDTLGQRSAPLQERSCLAIAIVQWLV